jgi:multisubunit Na+/H+ antiporter MnhE subunit
LTPASRMRRAGHRLPMAAWLWLLWLLLWGSTSPAVLVGGLLVAAAVVVAFPLPHLVPHTALRPGPLARLLAHLLTDLFSSAAVVAWEAVRHGRRTRTAVVEVPLRVDTDFLVAVSSGLTTLTPGSLVLEIDRERRLLYVHALPVRDRPALEERRREGRAVERRVSRTLGPSGGEEEPKLHREEGTS